MKKAIIIIFMITLLYIFIKYRFINFNLVKQYFKKLTIVVTGKRGKGKDTLFSAVYYNKENNANIPYNKKTNLIKINQIILPKEISRKSIETMTFEKLDYMKYKYLEKPTIISDAQINFPNYEDSQLKKEYQSLAISYQVWRHLYNAPLHFNTQNFDRLWKILREQVEDCIKCITCVRLPLYTYMKVRYYENAKDCIDNLKPIKVGLLQMMKTDIKIEQSKRGIIKDYRLLIPNYRITHDSTYYKKIIFNENTFQNKKRSKKQ